MFRFTISAILFIFSHSSFAQGTSTSSTSQFLDHVDVSLFSNFHGPEVTDIGSPYNPGQKGLVDSKRPSKMNFDSNITTAYQFDSGHSIGAVVPFNAYPVMGEGFTLGDVGMQFADRRFYRTREMTVNANVAFQMPTSTSSQLNGMDLAVKTSPFVRYIVPNSRVTLGAWTEAKAYLGVYAKKKSFKLWAQPYVNYQVTPDFSWNLGFEMEGNHFNGQPGMLDFTLVQSDFVPGFVYMISPKVMINPYLQIFTTEKVAMDRTAVGAIITARL